MADSLNSVKPLKAMARADLADGVMTAQTLDLNRAVQRELSSKEGLKAIQDPVFALLVGSPATWASSTGDDGARP